MSGDNGARHDRVSIKDETFFEMPVHLPCNEEQEKIATFLSLLEQKIELQRVLVDNLKKYKRGVNVKLLSYISSDCNRCLGDVCLIIGGGTPNTMVKEFWDGGVNWFTPSEIGKNKYVISSARSISPIGISKSSAKMLPKGTVLLTTRATLGEMSILQTKATTNQGFQSLVASDEILPEYVYYLQVLIKPWCEKYASGNTFREISKSSLSKCLVPVPDISMQEKIVGLLTEIDKHIVCEEEVLEKLRIVKKSLLQQLFI